MIKFILPFVLFFITTPLFSAPEIQTNEISFIKAYSDKDQGYINLSFRTPFKNYVSFLFEPGKLTAIIPSSHFSKENAFKRVNDQFIKNIQLRQEGKNTILNVYFADAKFNAGGKTTDEVDQKHLNILIFKTQSAFFKATKDQQARFGLPSDKSDQSEKIEYLKDSSQDYSTFASGLTTYHILKTLFALFFILMLIYLALWIYNRFFIKKFGYKNGKYDIKLTSSYHIGPKQKIVVLEINQQAFACGITNNNISVISRVSNPSFSEFIGNYTNSTQQTVDFSELRDQYLSSRRRQETPQVPPDETKSNFANELLDKIKNLKRIE
ncbi:MAG: flagellar biosynthetic protein FliO [Deltaproteobacteria bacterium]|nr:flagellar biosynthetic protein FliO [Deltaproteobacteria bacterium]